MCSVSITANLTQQNRTVKYILKEVHILYMYIIAFFVNVMVKYIWVLRDKFSHVTAI